MIKQKMIALGLTFAFGLCLVLVCVCRTQGLM